MKRSLILLALLSSLVLLFATPKRLALILPEHSGNQVRLANKLLEKGDTVYYYNLNYTIAALDPEEYPGYQYLQNPRGNERLYLISAMPASEAAKLQNNGSLYALPGGDFLLISALSDVELRALTKGSFVELLANPVQKARSGFKTDALRQTNQDITQLVSQVSADSVEFFIQALQDMQTRYALASNRFEVASWIKDTFQRFGIANAHLEEFTWNGTQQYNVVATIEGSLNPNEYIVVGGHHDSITYTTPYQWAPGADDNASGTVAALEVARVLMAANYQPKCSIRFVTFAAEEFGLHGSHYNAQQAVNNDTNIRLMINHDMIANNPNNTPVVRLMPYAGSLEHSEHASYLVSNYTDLSTVYGSMNSGSSDSYAYWSRGYPVIYFFELDFSQVYHSDNDTVANIDPGYCAEVIRGSLACAVSFANMPGAIENLSLTDIGDGNALRLSWQTTTDPDVNHVKVYMSTGDPATAEPVAVYDANWYLADGLIQGQTYNFAVSAVDALGNESYMAYISGSPLAIPRIPQNFSALPIADAIRLSWQANTELDLAGYRVWRAEFPNPDLLAIHEGLLTQTSFIDNDVLGAPEQLYMYQIQAVDTDGNSSDFSDLSPARPATLDNGILVIDGTTGGSGASPLVPTDQQVNDYYASVLSGFPVQHMDIAQTSRDLRLYDICIYSTIIWHDADSTTDVLAPEIRVALEDYLALGGKLIYNGYFPSKALEGNAGYPASFNPNTMINRVLGVMNADYSSQARMNLAFSIEDGLQSLQVGEHASMPAFNYHILKVEGLFPAENGDIWYTYGSGYDSESPYSSMQGYPVGIYSEFQQGKSLLLTFPLYVIDQAQASQMLYDILHTKWGETTSNEDALIPALAALRILPSYPNPFRESTNIQIKGSTGTEAPALKIFNLRGQLVRELAGSKSGNYNWDGRDGKGQSVGSGVYFLQVSENGNRAQRKLIKIK
jgi:hypothetical protein